MPDRWAEIARQNVESHRGHFVALADPFKVIAVNPRDIRWRCRVHSSTKREHGSEFHDWGKVLPGEWDVSWQGETNPPVDSSPKWAAVYERYVNGLSWEETGLIDAKMRKIEAGKRRPGGLRTREQYIDRYRRLDRIVEDIKVNGFRLTQEADGTFRNLFVSIGRDGRLLLSTGGNHRLAVAWALHIPTIPVYVLSRHWEWQRTRDRMARGCRPKGSSQAGLLEHPDLGDLRK